MKQEEQTGHFAKRLDELINYVRYEYQLTLANILGVLLIKMLSLYSEQRDKQNE